MDTLQNPPEQDHPIANTALVLYGNGEIAGGLCWASVIAGATATTALMALLLILGAGIGLSSVSPWFGVGMSTTAIGVSAIIWLIFSQWVSAGVGGFLAGRLRIRWTGLHAHEVFFRDTAQGFLVWSLATILGAALFALAAVAGLTGVGKVATSSATAVIAKSENAGDSMGYYVDSLFRSTPSTGADQSGFDDETLRILRSSVVDGQVVLSPSDSTYLAQLVAAKANISQADAEQRVGAVVKQLNDAKQKILAAADLARKRAAQISIVTALSLLVGAFVASSAAAFGGTIRDEY